MLPTRRSHPAPRRYRCTIFNHIRTLLLNDAGHLAPGAGYPCEELVPREFPGIEMPDYLHRVYRALFGFWPDRAMRNYRLQQFMTLLHESELAEYVTQFDSRITYQRGKPSAFLSRNPPTVTTQADARFFVLGEPEGVQDGPILHNHTVTVLETGRIQSAWDQARTSSTVENVTYIGGLSEPVWLENGLHVRVGEDAEPDDMWEITSLARPTIDPGIIAYNLEALGEPVHLKLFGIAPDEPYLSFRNAALKGRHLPIKMAGFLLATAWRLEALRTRTDG